MNRVTAAVLVVLGATIFGLVFIKQIRVSKDGLAEFFRDDNAPYRADVAGASIVNPAAGDHPVQIDRSVNAMNLDSIDSNSAKIEEQLKLMAE